MIEQGQGDAFVGVYDANGSFLDGFGVGGTESDAAWGLTLSGLNEVSIIGFYYSATIDMDPGPAANALTNLGGFDAYLATYHYLGTGVQENAAHGTMLISPNPASDKFSVLVNDPDVQHVELLNAMGAEAPVTVVSRSGERIELDASGCDRGIYLLRLITSTGAFAERVVLE